MGNGKNILYFWSQAYITLTCVNAGAGGAPYWDPPYDNIITPFPDCLIVPSGNISFCVRKMVYVPTS